MDSLEAMQKVVCYIVRDDELLVFKHLGQPWDESGLQVPAGTGKVGESPEAAAMREAREETGLDQLRLVRKLGVAEYDMRPYRDELQTRHVFRLEIDTETPDRWVARENDPGDGGRPIEFECYWIPIAQGHVLSAGQGALLGRL
ncbi:MAG TPA: NUDIX domain-containing protein [Nocardioidaceae bacterium]|nr:NUDIX domain-containing protein [Nocardioidaceae bacterium]